VRRALPIGASAGGCGRVSQRRAGSAQACATARPRMICPRADVQPRRGPLPATVARHPRRAGLAFIGRGGMRTRQLGLDFPARLARLAAHDFAAAKPPARRPPRLADGYAPAGACGPAFPVRRGPARCSAYNAERRFRTRPARAGGAARDLADAGVRSERFRAPFAGRAGRGLWYAFGSSWGAQGALSQRRLLPSDSDARWPAADRAAEPRRGSAASPRSRRRSG
jgi:hypothetical protein